MVPWRTKLVYSKSARLCLFTHVVCAVIGAFPPRLVFLLLVREGTEGIWTDLVVNFHVESYLKKQVTTDHVILWEEVT